MDIARHKFYTKQAAEACVGHKDGDEIRKEITIGSYANDLCEFTSLYTAVIRKQAYPQAEDLSLFKTVLDSAGDVIDDILDRLKPAIYRSHFGNLASIHSMAKKKSEKALATQKEIALWIESLNLLALGRTIDPSMEIKKDSLPVSGLLSAHNDHTAYWQLFGTDSREKIRYRSVGMICHLIQDSFTKSHCLREIYGEKKIVKFYEYSSQDSEKHRDGDYVLPELEGDMSRQCTLCIDSLLCKKEAYNCDQLLQLSGNAQSSDGGVFFVID
jgi:hypothetical protein